MTPAENKQTVEALAERVRSAMANAVALRSEGYYKAAAAQIDKHEAALRDLVAQADRAAELEAALRDAGVVIERMANGASRRTCSPELDNVIATLSALDAPNHVDDLQRRADEIHAADRAQDHNHGRDE